ncbi:MAG: hypothetical protein J1E64_06230 [Acetatifactor sp.]|nr:hypothetical protein [Acetatifactor sp.]
MDRKIMPLVLMLVAGAVTCVITFIKDFSMHSRLVTLLIVLLVFYFLGSVMKWALDYFDEQNGEDEENEQDEENEENEEKSAEEGEVIEKDTDVESEEEEESENEQ